MLRFGRDMQKGCRKWGRVEAGWKGKGGQCWHLLVNKMYKHFVSKTGPCCGRKKQNETEWGTCLWDRLILNMIYGYESILSHFVFAFVTDMNECDMHKGGCDQICVNTIGSFHCECDDGYSLMGDSTTCRGSLSFLIPLWNNL